MYTEVDCSRKMCPKGNDVLDTRMNTEDTLLYQVQTITFSNMTVGNTFALTFKSTINETYTTQPIQMYSSGATTAAAMQTALLMLPNKVIDGVAVNSTTKKIFTVYFSGTSVSGPQNLLMVDTNVCADGCTPQLTGIDVIDSAQFGLSSVVESTAADYNNYECGRRGKCDYDSGICECFEGYTGLACGTQTALV